MPIQLFGPTYDLLSKTLDLRSQRHGAVASNIANAETPNYKSVQVSFEDELQKTLPRDDKLKMKTTHPGHMPALLDPNDVTAAVEYEDTQVMRPDGNTVDLDREIVKMSKNQLMYNAVSRLLSKKFSGLKNTMKEAK